VNCIGKVKVVVVDQLCKLGLVDHLSNYVIFSGAYIVLDPLDIVLHNCECWAENGTESVQITRTKWLLSNTVFFIILSLE